MLPDLVKCSGCEMEYLFPRGAFEYVLNFAQASLTVEDDDLLSMPLAPVWCSTCRGPSYAENLQAASSWGDLRAQLRAGVSIEYPFDSSFCSPAIAEELLNRYHRVLSGRFAPGRCVSCGGVQHMRIDAALKHEGCDGFLTPHVLVASVNYQPNAYRLYDRSGAMIGRLLSRSEDEQRWLIERCTYGE
jgi:hypothetical protein